MLAPGELFDVTPFVDSHCTAPIEEISPAIDGAISPEQVIKLRQCLKHIDEDMSVLFTAKHLVS